MYLTRIRTNATRMGQLITDLLSLARLTRAELHRERVDISSMAVSIVNDLRLAEPERKVDVQISCGLEGFADARLLRVALQNLLGNAWKFTSKTPGAQIRMGRQEDGERCYFIADNGAGFDMEYQSHLFAPFQRLHQAAEFEGTGIGLATVHRIVQRHQGSIRGEGKVDEGATFYFTLGEEKDDQLVAGDEHG